MQASLPYGRETHARREKTTRRTGLWAGRSAVRPGAGSADPGPRPGMPTPRAVATLVLLIALLPALLATACGRPGRADAQAAEVRPIPGGTLNILHQMTSNTDPAAVDDAYEATVVNMVYEGLLRLDSDLGVSPCLARTWTVGEDGRLYRLVLRDGVRFQDGRPLDAECVVGSIERALDPRKEAPCLAETYLLGIEGARDFVAGRASHVRGLRAAGDTVEIRLAEPLGYFLSVLCMDQLKIVPRLAPGESPNRNPVGTGPFRFVERRPNGDILLARFEDHWGGRAFPDSLHFVVPKPNADAAEQVAMLVRAEVHVIPLPASQRRTVEEMAGYRILRSPDFSISFLGLNRNHPPLDRAEVRRAIAMAIDRTKLISPAARGTTNPATGILPPRMAGYRPDPKVLPFDPDSARALLLQAGYRPDRTVPPIDFYSGSADTSLYCRELRRQLADVGIELRTHQLEWSALDARLNRGEAPMFALSWIADIPDPDAILFFLFHSGEPNNLVAYHDAAVDSMLEAGRRMRPGAERFDLYRRTESVILADAPIVPVSTGISLYAWDPSVRGVEPNPFGFSLTPFDHAWFAPPSSAGDPLTERLP
jgi:ABC-type transport system substrate-binding protein